MSPIGMAKKWAMPGPGWLMRTRFSGCSPPTTYLISPDSLGSFLGGVDGASEGFAGEAESVFQLGPGRVLGFR